MKRACESLDGKAAATPVRTAEAAGFAKPFEVIEPARLRTPIVFNSPHSGAVYSQAFLAASRLDALTLRRSEDAFVDELYLRCVDIGAPLLRAHFPRAFLDVNREPFELDPQMFTGSLPAFANTRSLRVASGLGTIPRVVGDAQPIYRGPMPVAEGLARIAELYKPYHEILHGLLDRSVKKFGLAVLIDCHSMPSHLSDGGAPDFVLGDRFGASAAPSIIEVMEANLKGAGYLVRRNKPYSGGFITEHYGAPTNGCHAVQIEISRGLYMDEGRLSRKAGWSRICDDLFRVAKALAEHLDARIARPPLAAE